MRLYRKPLKSEIEETGAKLEFVDKELILGWDDVHISRKDPNKKYVMGTAPVPPKIRYPPYLGAAFVRRRELKSWMMGTWLAETTPDDPERQRLGALRVVAEFQIQGLKSCLHLSGVLEFLKKKKKKVNFFFITTRSWNRYTGFAL